MTHPKLQWSSSIQVIQVEFKILRGRVWKAKLSENTFPLSLICCPSMNLVQLLNQRMAIQEWTLPAAMGDLADKLAHAEQLAVEHIKESYRLLLQAYGSERAIEVPKLYL